MTLSLVPESQLEPWALVWHPLEARAEPWPASQARVCGCARYCVSLMARRQGNKGGEGKAGQAAIASYSSQFRLTVLLS